MKTVIVVTNEHNKEYISIPYIHVLPRVGEKLSISQNETSIEGVVASISHEVVDYKDHTKDIRILQTIRIKVW